jgi:ferredoxin-NADP reductase
MKLLRVEQIADGTFAFHFERPEGFEFVAGQFVEIALEELSPSDPFRSFSIASAPCEPDIIIATRVRDSSFKQALRSLTPGIDIQVEGPYGKFVLREGDGLPHVLIAGGIGITPFRSMIVQAAADGSRAPILLFHANRDAAGAPFSAEMVSLGERESGFRFIPTLTRPSEGWTGEKGYVDVEMLARYVDIGSAMFHISGPPAMVQSTKEMLAVAEVPADRIFAESFQGY